MNSSWKVFRALSAASQMGMSLWRMYSAREQDQPPSVLLVGTFYENQQERGPGGRFNARVSSHSSPAERRVLHVHPWFLGVFSYSPFFTVSLDPIRNK